MCELGGLSASFFTSSRNINYFEKFAKARAKKLMAPANKDASEAAGGNTENRSSTPDFPMGKFLKDRKKRY